MKRPLFLTTLLLMLLCSACVRIPVPGNRDISQFGGNLVADYQADSSGNITSLSVVSEMHESFKAGADVLGRFLDTLTTAYFTNNLLKVRETTQQMETAGMTKKQIAEIDANAKLKAAELAAKTDVTKSAIGAGAVPAVNPITPP